MTIRPLWHLPEQRPTKNFLNLISFTGRSVVSSWAETIMHRVDEIVQQHASTIAVREPQHGRAWTYRDLGERTTAVARVLLAADVPHGARVAVFQEAGMDFVCSMLAIMRIGAVFVPIDVDTPVERLKAMVETARPTVVLFHNASASHDVALATLQDRGARSIRVPETITSPPNANHVRRDVPIVAKARDAAMVLFTSGSTGVPKGLLLPHEGLPNSMEHTHIQGPEVVLHHTALGFDLASLQCFWALAHGGTLVVAGRALRGDPMAITALMVEEGVTCTSATPSEYRGWIEHGFSKLARCSSWRLAMTVGEQCTPDLVDDFRKLQLPDLRLWNCYGPSETTWASHQTEVSLKKPLDGPAPVGPTMPNRSVYILDSKVRPVSVGVPGEVFIGGVGLALEYLDLEELTRERFLPDPFARVGGKEKERARMYRTGDRGRLTAEGALEILGRIDGDSQIKLRGIRIELQDIEQMMLRSANNALAGVCVTTRGDPPTLVAHVVFRPDCSVPQQQRDGFLRRLARSLPLPQYMHPAVVVPIQSMPLTPFGKLDRLAVQGMTIQFVAASRELGMESQTAGEVPLSPPELALRSVWEQVIPSDVRSRHTVDRNTDFFHVGGNSMLLIKLQHLIRQELGATIPIVRLFENSTLGSVAAMIDDASLSCLHAHIDWEEETALSKALIDAMPSPGQQPSQPTAAGQIVILTGATGFIGRELLTQLNASPDIAQIHCIAVRTPSKLAAFPPTTHPKISIHPGDLSNLSFPDEALFSTATTLIHCGADVSFLKSYPSLRRPNLLATKYLARLAVRHRLAFHYISTIATGRLLLSQRRQDDAFGEQSVAAHPPPPGWRDGYVASKWASEAFLERAATRLGLRVWVHRPSSVTGAGAGDTDVMVAVVRFSKMMKAVPVSKRWRGVLDFVAVERAAEGVLCAVRDGGGEGGGEGLVRFLHHCGERVVPVQGMKEFLEAEDGVQYRTVSLREWIGMATAEGMDVLVATYLGALDEADEDVVFQSYVKGT